MNTLGLGDGRLAPEPRKGRRRAFMRRQFDETPTPEQTKFDIFFGIVFPVVCFVFDPFVFRNFGGGGGLLAEYQFFTYSLAAFEMTSTLPSRPARAAW